MLHLERARALGGRESGLAVAITVRSNGQPRASVVNAGVVVHPLSGEPVVGFVSRGSAHKLRDLRRSPRATVVFRSGWDWLAVEGDVVLVGPDDPHDGFDYSRVRLLVRTVYAAAVGGTADEWAALDETMETERHTAVLVTPSRLYPAPIDDET